MSKTTKSSEDPGALGHLMAAARAEARNRDDAEARLDPGSGRGARTVPWNRIRVAEGHNPRRRIRTREIDALAATIRDRGLLQPLVVRADGDGGYVLVAGERRYRAIGRLVKWGESPEVRPVPVMVRDEDAPEALLDALIENCQRADLGPLDEADAFARLRDEHGMSTQQIADALGVSRRTVQIRLQLLQLAPEVREALDAGEIPVDVARVLAGAPHDLQCEALAWHREAPGEQRSAEALRAHLRARAIPFGRGLFDSRVYTRAHGGPVYDGGRAGKFYADPALFVRLQQAALIELRAGLGDEREWVEVVEADRLPPGYEEAEDGPGAVILLRNGLFEIEVLRSVRRVEPSGWGEAAAADPGGAGFGIDPDGGPSPGSSRPVRPLRVSVGGSAEESAPAGGSPAAGEPDSVEAPFPGPEAVGSGTVGAFPPAALQDALASRPETSLRLAITMLLDRPGSSGVRMVLPPSPPCPAPGSRLARPLRSLARAVGLGDSAGELMAVLADPGAERPDPRETYRALARFPGPSLQRIFAALVALAVVGPAPDPLLVQLADDLGLAGREGDAPPAPARAEPEETPAEGLRARAAEDPEADPDGEAGRSEGARALRGNGS